MSGVEGMRNFVRGVQVLRANPVIEGDGHQAQLMRAAVGSNEAFVDSFQQFSYHALKVAGLLMMVRGAAEMVNTLGAEGSELFTAGFSSLAGSEGIRLGHNGTLKRVVYEEGYRKKFDTLVDGLFGHDELREIGFHVVTDSERKLHFPTQAVAAISNLALLLACINPSGGLVMEEWEHVRAVWHGAHAIPPLLGMVLAGTFSTVAISQIGAFERGKEHIAAKLNT